MSFLNPWLLLAAAGVAAPVLIHLLNRHRPKTIEWGAMELLRRVVRVRARQLRLQDILLMLLRCLAILLLVLALSRPTLRSSSPVSGADVGVLVAVDNSAGMGHQPGVESRLDQAKQRAKEIFATLGPGRPVTLVSVASQPRILLRNVGFEQSRFTQALESITPSDEVLSPQRCLEDLAPLAEELQAPQRETYLISDVQSNQWDPPDQGLIRGVEDLAALGQVTLVPVEAKGQENAAVVDLYLAGGALQLGALARFDARVTNFSTSTMDVGEVTLLVDGKKVDRAFVGPMPPGQSVTVPLRTNWSRQGPARVTAEIQADALEIDNRRYLSVDIHKSPRVLIVDGGSGDPGQPSPSHYLAVSLSPRSEAVARLPIETETVSWLSLPNVSLEEYDVVFLANVARLSDAKVSALFDFVSRGGGLFVFIGENVKIDAWNQGMWRDEQFLLPGQLVGPADLGGPEGQALPLDPVIPDHPLLGPVRALPAETLTDCRFSRVMKVQPVEKSRTLLHLAAAGGPILMERRIGEGTVLMLTSTADRSWNNLPLNPVLPLVVQQAITYLSRRPYEAAFSVGQTALLPLPVPSDVDPGEVTVTDPSGQIRQIQPQTAQGRPAVDLGLLDRAGFYEVEMQDGQATIPLAVNLDPRESDLRAAEATTLRDQLATTSTRVAQAGAPLGSTIRAQRVGKELWIYFLLAGLAVVLIEAILARWFTRRKLQPSQGDPVAAPRAERIGKAA
jgi:hypothetical protein